MIKETVTISKREYEELLASVKVLNALQEFGVDNWEGYGDAMSSLEENDSTPA